jgi:methylase of polypeptide subunit release factors
MGKMADHPTVDRAAASALGDAVRATGYNEPAVRRLLGDDAYSLDREDAPLGERRLPRSPLGTVIRAFFLELPVSAREAVRALGRRAVDALEATGLADVGADVVPRGRILPVGDLLVASDDYPSDEVEDPPDFVAAYTPTSQLCASLTPRRRIDRALDVGTGSGVLALFAARHAKEVVATDVNPRALAYAELNASLNGITNLECRLGSLFDPVAGESFDLITSNAPYVVSPETRFVYRDAGLEGDEVSERVVRAAARHLREGGFATMLLSWIATDADDPDERVLAWIEPLECDAWILPVWGSDPIEHAAIWNEHLAGDGDRYEAALEEWTGYLARLGGEWVTEGAVLLHRREERVHTTRIDEIDDETLGNASAQVERAFAARARLADRGELLDARLAVAARLRLERSLDPRRRDGGAHVELDEGTMSSIEVPPHMLEVVASLDGKTRLRDAVKSVATRLELSATEASRLDRDAVKVSRELLELGALEFR